MNNQGHINTNKAHERTMAEVAAKYCGADEVTAAKMRAFARKASLDHGCQDRLREAIEKKGK